LLLFTMSDLLILFIVHHTSLISFDYIFFFFNDPPTTEIYTLSLHDALPICLVTGLGLSAEQQKKLDPILADTRQQMVALRDLPRSEEHTSELQSRSDLVCRLLLEKKKKKKKLPSPLISSIKYRTRLKLCCGL